MSNTKQNYAMPFAIMAFLLFLLGFVSWINNILIPFMEIKFEITPNQAQLVNAAFFSAYIISIPVGSFVTKVGYKMSVIIGAVITALGCAIFIPALSIGYSMILVGLFITAVGIVIIQVAANPYVIGLGSPKTSASRLTLIMAVNSVAAVLAPIIGGVILDSSGDSIVVNEQLAKTLFMTLSAVAVGSAFLIIFMPLPEIESEGDGTNTKGERSPWSYPQVVLGFIAVGLYMGLELGVVNFFLDYVQYNVEEKTTIDAIKILGFYPILFVVGRTLGGLLLKVLSPSKVLLGNSIVGVLLLITFFLTKGTVFSIWPLIGQGLFFSIMWPVIFDLSLKDVPASIAKHASGIICTGIVFTGLWLFVMGKIVDGATITLNDVEVTNYGSAYTLFFFFYAYIIYYAVKGSKIRN